MSWSGVICRYVACLSLRIYADTHVDSLIIFLSLSKHIRVFDYVGILFLVCKLHFLSIFLICYSISLVVISCSANNKNLNPAVMSSEVRELSQVAGTNATSNTRVIDTGIDRGLPGWSVAEYNVRYADM